MNSKQRVWLALEHRAPDRVPLDYTATPEAHARVMKFLGVSEDAEVKRTFGIDFRHVFPKYAGPEERHVSEDDGADIFGIERKAARYDSGVYYEVSRNNLAGELSREAIDGYRWPSPDWFDYSGMSASCDAGGDACIVIASGALFHRACDLRGMENILVDMCTQPGLVEALIERISAFFLAFHERCFQAVGGKADIHFFWDDFGTQNGPLVSRKMWRKFFRRPYQQWTDLAHRYGLKAVLHSCGSVRDLIPEFIDAGIDVLNPVQISARDMAPGELKKEFGGELCFWGGVDVQSLLPMATHDEVLREVERLVDVLGAGGGYVLGPTHSIQADTPPENVLAIYEKWMPEEVVRALLA